MDINTRETNHIGMDMIYQAYITNYIKRKKYLKQNMCDSHTVIWEFYNKQLQNSIKTNV